MPSLIRTEVVDSPYSDRAALRRGLFWGIAFIVLVLDQVTKVLVRAYMEPGEIWPSSGWPVRLYHVTNTGAAFGILQDQTVFLIVTALIGLGAIYLYYRFPPFEHPLASLAVGMMLGGAAGNLVDRVRLGRVTDFISFPHYPSFNVADSSITIGIAVLILGAAFLAERPKTKPDADS